MSNNRACKGWKKNRNETKIEKKCKGRPESIDKETIERLIDGFSKDFNVAECCRYANIYTSVYYGFINRHPEYRELFESCRQDNGIKAKNILQNSLVDGDKETAKWYLERRRKDEYSTKTVQESTDIVVDIATKEGKIDEILDKFSRRADDISE